MKAKRFHDIRVSALGVWILFWKHREPFKSFKEGMKFVIKEGYFRSYVRNSCTEKKLWAESSGNGCNCLSKTR